MKYHFYYIRPKEKIKIFAVITALLVVFIIIFRDNNKEEVKTVFNPIISVATEQTVFSITAELSEKTQLTDLRTFLEVADGLKVKITFFTKIEFLKTNEETIKEIINSSYEIGLLIDTDTSKMSRNEVMRFIANLNDDFYKKCDRYPKYIKSIYEAESSGVIFDVLAAFGQYSIGTDSDSEAKNGAIVDIGNIDGTSTSKIISLVTEAVNNKLTAVSLRDLLYDVNIPADKNGIQNND